MTPRWRGVAARLAAGGVVGFAVGILYDRNTRAFVPPEAGVDWGAVLAAAVTLGSLLAGYEVLAWLLRVALTALGRRRGAEAGAPRPPGP